MTTSPLELGIIFVHSPRECEHQKACPMHKPSGHKMSGWEVTYKSYSNTLERMCPECGCGHPDPDQSEYWHDTGMLHKSMHGCCGACMPQGCQSVRTENEGW